MSKKANYIQVKEDFEKCGLILLSTTYTGVKQYLKCQCMKHTDNVFEIRYETVKTWLRAGKYGCRICQSEHYYSRYNMTDDEYANIVKEVNPHITLLSKYNSVKEQVRYMCNEHDIPYYGKVHKQRLLKPFQCPWCKNGHEQIEIGETDIKSMNPVMYDMLLDKSINEKCNIYSLVKTDFICPSCGAILKNKSIDHVYHRGFKCNCMDGNSLGEKFFDVVIRKVDSNIDTEFHINNNNSYRYDFGGYKNGVYWICEIQGKQHSEKSFETCGGRSLEEEIENDRLKKEYALNNGIDLYIEIDSKKSGYHELIDGILNSELVQLYDFSEVDWVECYRVSLKSEIIAVCNLWNDGYKVMEICDIKGIGKNTVRDYLTKGNDAGFCEYDHTNSNRTSVICLNTGEVFRSQRDAERRYNLHRGYLFDYLNGIRKMVIDNVEYKWEYYIPKDD